MSRTAPAAMLVSAVFLTSACSSGSSPSEATQFSIAAPSTVPTSTRIEATDPADATPTNEIVANDTLFDVAERTDASVADIVAANEPADRSGHLLLAGDIIKLPAGVTTDTPTGTGPGASTDPTSDGESGLGGYVLDEGIDPLPGLPEG